LRSFKSVVLDLGAGIGDFSVLASRMVGPDGKVIALELNAENYEMLEMNAEKNGCEHIISLKIGVAEEPWKRSHSRTEGTALRQTR
jgi:FkbM family methyltransferase